MPHQEDKQNSNDLLKGSDTPTKIGELKIFLGVAPGVGKTYLMLKEAQKKLRDGVDVAVGTINTHARKETEELLQGLPIIREKWIKYKEVVFRELDLESILNKKPKIILIDELAHTNVPGSKNTKRWQDVFEILDAGIDVYTTLNIQHIESQKSAVESLLGIQIRETIPDFILERATTIEFIDIAVNDLLGRLKEGKIYLGDQSRSAIQNFFQEKNLKALREIALRFRDEKVDSELHGIPGKRWKTPERLMVAISANTYSENLIRKAKHLALELEAPWIAVYVDEGITLSDEDQKNLNRHLHLARELGAEVITVYDLNVFAALQRIAKQKNITRLLISRPIRKKFSLKKILQGSFFDPLESENRNIDILILREEFTESPKYKLPMLLSPWKGYRLALVFGAVITAIGFLISPFLGYKSVGFIFLLGILSLSFFVGRGPIFFAALLSALCWDFLFIPPVFTLIISDPEDITLVIIYFIIAGIMGILTSRMHEQEQLLQKNEEKIKSLYEIQKECAIASNFQNFRLNVSKKLTDIFPGNFDILTKNQDNQLIFDSRLPFLREEKEKIVARWVFQHGEIAGWSTNTLSSAKGIYFPIKVSKSIIGVLAYYPIKESSLLMEEMDFIDSVTQQLSIYLKKYLLEEQMNRQSYTHQVEHLHQSFFHSINRIFLTTVDRLTKINHQIQKLNKDPNINSLLDEIEKVNYYDKFILNNINIATKIDSGCIPFDRKMNSIRQLIDCSLHELKLFIDGHTFEITIPSQADIPFDFDLLKIALSNLILNSIENSSSSTPLHIQAKFFVKEFCLSIFYNKTENSSEISPLLFDKFHQDKTLIELGPKIVRSIIDVHQGRIEVKNLSCDRIEISIILPL